MQEAHEECKQKQKQKQTEAGNRNGERAHAHLVMTYHISVQFQLFILYLHFSVRLDKRISGIMDSKQVDFVFRIFSVSTAR